MNAEPNECPDASVLTRLLKLGVQSAGGPIDELLERLEADDGESWFRSWLEDEPLGVKARDVLAGDVPLDEVEEIVALSKRELARARSREDRVEAVALYFFAVAAAVSDHGKVLSGASRGELDGIFIELASALPEPWSNRLELAVSRPPNDLR